MDIINGQIKRMNYAASDIAHYRKHISSCDIAALKCYISALYFWLGSFKFWLKALNESLKTQEYDQ